MATAYQIPTPLRRTLATGITAGQIHRGDAATSMASSTTTNCYGAHTSSGTLTKLGPIVTGNLLGPGLLWFPPSDIRPIITPGAFLTMEALATFASLTHYLTVYVNELN